LSNNKIQLSKITKYNHNKQSKHNDYIAIESPLEIRLGHDKSSFQTLAITMCSPDDIVDLSYGYLFTEKIITQSKDIISTNIFDNKLGLIVEIILDKSISYGKFLNKRHGIIHASCGVCGKTEFEDLLTFSYQPIIANKINPKVIQSLSQKLNFAQSSFKQTGGLHASSLFDSHGKLIYTREDIGRHNALDKLIGAALQQQLLPLADYIILLSGRVSYEQVHKSLMAGVTTLSALGAPSSLSIEIASLNRLNLIGFVTDKTFNVY